MMMKLAGGPGSVSPLDFNARKRPTPPWIWAAIAVSLLAHGAAGIWLYQQRFELRPSVVPPEPPTTIVDILPMVRVIRPDVVPAQTPPPTAIRAPALNPVAPVQTTPFTPADTIVAAPFDPVIVPPSLTPAVGAPSAPPASPGPAVIQNPQWLSTPSADQLARAYPPRAARDGAEGSALIQCSVTARGGLTDCSVQSETPGGYGFGRAAMQLSRHFRLSPRTVDGQAVEGARVSIPLAFRLN